jgi:hypothetical protein
MTSPRRTIELDVIVLATPAAVWKALSSGEGLKQWFPPMGRSIPFIVGRVEPAILWGTLPSLNEGLFMIELEPGDDFHYGIYVSLYGVPPRDVASLRSWITAVADRSVASGSPARSS